MKRRGTPKKINIKKEGFTKSPNKAMGTVKSGPMLAEEISDVFLGKFFKKCIIVCYQVFHQIELALLQHHDFLLNGIFTNQAIGKYTLGLSDTMGTVDSLLLHGGVPPRVHNIYIICSSKVKTHTTGFERDEENAGSVIFLKVLNSFFALGHRSAPVEVNVRDTQLF